MSGAGAVSPQGGATPAAAGELLPYSITMPTPNDGLASGPNGWRAAWWRFVPAASGRVQFDLSLTSFYARATVLHSPDGSADASQFVSLGFDNFLDMPLAAGEVYYVAVQYVYDDTATYVLAVSDIGAVGDWTQPPDRTDVWGSSTAATHPANMSGGLHRTTWAGSIYFYDGRAFGFPDPRTSDEAKACAWHLARTVGTRDTSSGLSLWWGGACPQGESGRGTRADSGSASSFYYEQFSSGDVATAPRYIHMGLSAPMVYVPLQVMLTTVASMLAPVAAPPDAGLETESATATLLALDVAPDRASDEPAADTGAAFDVSWRVNVVADRPAGWGGAVDLSDDTDVLFPEGDTDGPESLVEVASYGGSGPAAWTSIGSTLVAAAMDRETATGLAGLAFTGVPTPALSDTMPPLSYISGTSDYATSAARNGQVLQVRTTVRPPRYRLTFAPTLPPLLLPTTVTNPPWLRALQRSDGLDAGGPPRAVQHTGLRSGITAN